jgi:hypothetical protein
MMVTKGNPKAIATIDGLVRSDVRTSMPNPVNEGIMQFYARTAAWRQLARRGIVRDRRAAERPAPRKRGRLSCVSATKVARDGCATSALQKPGGSSWPSSRSPEGGGATMSQSEANGCRFANYRPPAIGSCRARACCSIPPRRRRSAPITLDSRWPRQCDVRCD